MSRTQYCSSSPARRFWKCGCSSSKTFPLYPTTKIRFKLTNTLPSNPAVAITVLSLFHLATFTESLWSFITFNKVPLESHNQMYWSSEEETIFYPWHWQVKRNSHPKLMKWPRCWCPQRTLRCEAAPRSEQRFRGLHDNHTWSQTLSHRYTHISIFHLL